MRDILVASIVLIGCLNTLKNPYVGILLWSWLSYMNPHRLAYGFAYSAPFAQITAIVLVISMFISKGAKKPPVNALIVIWVFYIIFMGITAVSAYFPIEAKAYYSKVLKVQFVVFLTMMLITDLDKLSKLIWVIVISIGFYTVKGGIFTLLTGGGYIVFGPSGSFIEDNNELAVAGLMIVPLMMYLYYIQEKKWIKILLILAIVSTLFSVCGSQSRGAFLAIFATGFFYWTKSQRKLLSAFIILFVGLSVFSFMPESWYKRMNTIQGYENDGSAMGRINAWHYAFNAANDNLLGMGFESWTPKTFAIYAPNPTDVHVAHSIYFSVLGDHGWIGLIIYFLVYFLTLRKLVKIIKMEPMSEIHKSYIFLAKMLQISFISYFVGGAFVSLSYYDLPWHLIGFVVLIEDFIKKEGQVKLNYTKSIKFS